MDKAPGLVVGKELLTAAMWVFEELDMRCTIGKPFGWFSAKIEGLSLEVTDTL
jgi:hypothetical protein